MVVEKKVYAGKTIEVSRYHINHIPKGPRGKRQENTPDRIRKANLRRRADRLRQLMNCNFDDTCWSLTLTYKKGKEPKSIREVRRDAGDFVKRLRKCARLFGADLKFVYVIGAGKHRRHIHITVNALPDMAIFAGCWIHGHVNMTKLYSDGQYRDLADYYIQNAQETKEQEEALKEDPGQMYVTSKNLKQPVIEKQIYMGRMREDPQPVKGYYIEKESMYKGFTSMGFPLIRYTLIKERENAGNASIHLHRSPADRGGNGSDAISAPVHKRRRIKSVRTGKGECTGDVKPERRHAGDHDRGYNPDKRREPDTAHGNMPLPERLHDKPKQGLLRQMVTKCLEKLKGCRG